MNNVKKIYKYRSFSGKYGMSNIEDIILRNLIRWQSPACFNDPFDCVPNFDKNISTERLKNHLKKLAYNENFLKGRKGKIASINKITKNPKKYIEYIELQYRNKLRDSSVSCFSECKNNPLMWAHYGESHTGIMFEFETSGDTGRFQVLKVKYVKERPLIDPTNFMDDNDIIVNSILTKSEIWSYEKEVRMVEISLPGNRTFPSRYLKSITFGLKTSPENKKCVLDMVRNRNTPISVFQCDNINNSYDIISNILPFE